MWVAVTKRFTNFQTAISLGPESQEDGEKKYKNITEILNKAYWNSESKDDNRLMVGSWGKGTAVNPAYDVDMFFVLHADVYHRFNGYSGNKQSSLLQEVKSYLAATYSQTSMRGDGQVVQVKYNSLMIEVVPAFGVDDGTYLICDTNDGGSWKGVNPALEMSNLSTAHQATNYNVRKMSKAIKVWRDFCNVDLPSYVIEALVVRFLYQYQYTQQSYFYHDWFVRDFFEYLIGRSNHSTQTLDGGWHAMGDAWKSRAESAFERAKKACDFERDDDVELAGVEWQKIFGAWIEITP